MIDSVSHHFCVDSFVNSGELGRESNRICTDSLQEKPFPGLLAKQQAFQTPQGLEPRSLKVWDTKLTEIRVI